MRMRQNDKVQYTRELASKFKFECEIFYHEESGRTTEDAIKATGLDSKHIIKCLLLKSKNNEYLGAIVRGSDKIDFKTLEQLSGYKDLRMAQPSDVEKELDFEVGGVPAVIFSEKKIRAFVDENVLNLDFVVGSGGTPHHGLRFNPRQLVGVLNYAPAKIARKG